MPFCGSTSGRNTGESTVTMILQSTIYVTIPLSEPLSFCTMTADAVAVGQTKQIIALSNANRPMYDSRHAIAARAQTINKTACTLSSTTCHLCSRRSRGRILRNDSVSMANNSVGCMKCVTTSYAVSLSAGMPKAAVTLSNIT